MADTWELLDRARDGDQSAIASLLEGVLPEVRAFIRVNTGAQIRAQESSSDLIQSVCREVIEGIDDFRGTGNRQFKKWLFTLALNKIRGRHRFQSAARRDVTRKVALDDPDAGYAEILECYSRFCTPSRVVQAREEVSRVEDAMQDLPDDYREVITLSCIMGLPHREVALEMDRPETAVRKLLSRARARLSLVLAQGET